MAVLATEFSLLTVVLAMTAFLAWATWLFFLFFALWDNFRRGDRSGWAKAGWTLFVIFLPVLGVLVYMAVRPDDERLAPA